MSNNGETLLLKVNQLYGIVSKIAREADHKKILELTVEGAMKLTNADGATLYIVTDDDHLKFEIFCSESLGIRYGGKSFETPTFEPLPLHLDTGPNLHNVACYSVLEDKIVNIPDAYLTQEFDFSRTRTFDKQTGYRSKSFLTIPLKNHEQKIVGVLQLINALHPSSGFIIPFSEEAQMFAEFLAFQAAVTMTNFDLISQQEQLFFTFADVIATAIDDKSPHTGEHCKRVPIITMMLAEAACKAEWGPFKGFSMNDTDRKELMLAGILHDCGKITTPVHVIEKATKLETIIDRISLVDTRFEVLKRDRKIEYLEKKVALLEKGAIKSLPITKKDIPSNGETSLKEHFENYKNELLLIEEEKAFIQEVNIGGEFISQEKVDRIKEIAERKWKNEEGIEANFLNFDEVKCLSIARGTLTAEEREIINRHIDITIKMLEKLPFPPHLERVPEFAGGHHERMDGKGRPKGLKRHEMSLQARIMGVAEIFEALTAKDRPYKKGKTLSESLNILGYMKKDHHIDPDCFQLIIESGVFLDYANRFVDPAQIDNVDYKKIPGYDFVSAQARADGTYLDEEDQNPETGQHIAS